jgi:hypothetical protein
MTYETLYLKPLTLPEIGFCQKMKVPMWCSWHDNQLYINKNWWLAQHPKAQQTMAELLKQEEGSRVQD